MSPSLAVVLAVALNRAVGATVIAGEICERSGVATVGAEGAVLEDGKSRDGVENWGADDGGNHLRDLTSSGGAVVNAVAC